MPRAYKSNEHFKADNSGNSDNTPYQLPSLPSWKTPKLDSHRSHSSYKHKFTTPLKKPPALLVYHSEQMQEPQDEYQGYELDEEEILSIKEHKGYSDMEYDYHPLSQKPLLSESKIRGFLQSERAAHCLVFHKNGHRDGMSSYRPDIEWECGEFDYQQGSEEPGSLLQSVPGCTKEDLNLLLNKNFMSRRPNKRQKYDDILNRKVNELRRFWGDSDLTSTLSRKHIHVQFRILRREFDSIRTSRLILRRLNIESPKGLTTAERSPSPDTPRSDSESS